MSRGNFDWKLQIFADLRYTSLFKLRSNGNTDFIIPAELSGISKFYAAISGVRLLSRWR